MFVSNSPFPERKSVTCVRYTLETVEVMIRWRCHTPQCSRSLAVAIITIRIRWSSKTDEAWTVAHVFITFYGYNHICIWGCGHGHTASLCEVCMYPLCLRGFSPVLQSKIWEWMVCVASEGSCNLSRIDSLSSPYVSCDGLHNTAKVQSG